MGSEMCIEDRHFDLKVVSRGGAIFDFDKFLWLAGEYLHKETDEVLAEHCLPFVVDAGLYTEADLRARWDWYLRVIAMEKERIRLYGELPARMAYLSAQGGQVEYLPKAVPYTPLRAHETSLHLVCRLLLEKKNLNTNPFPLCIHILVLTALTL